MTDLNDPKLTPARRPAWLMADQYIQKVKPTPHWADRLISDLGLPPSATGTLGKEFRTFGQLDNAPDDAILALKGIGPEMLKRIRAALTAWKWEPDQGK